MRGPIPSLLHKAGLHRAIVNAGRCPELLSVAQDHSQRLLCQIGLCLWARLEPGAPRSIRPSARTLTGPTASCSPSWVGRAPNPGALTRMGLAAYTVKRRVPTSSVRSPPLLCRIAPLPSRTARLQPSTGPTPSLLRTTGLQPAIVNPGCRCPELLAAAQKQSQPFHCQIGRCKRARLEPGVPRSMRPAPGHSPAAPRSVLPVL